MEEVILTTRKVAEIEGDFVIPSYQRGYRWDTEVTRLLDDVFENGRAPYCLQPVVVKRDGSRYRVVDGQQRLTTIFLIYRYFYDSYGGRGISMPKFSLDYEIRKSSKEYLGSLDPARRRENIDFYYMANAYDLITEWFERFGTDEKKYAAINNIRTYFVENVSVIWYEIDSSEDERALFIRLNVGKIRLTNAELVKAMLLSNSYDPDLTEERKGEIAMQWDAIERELHRKPFWYFLTNGESGEARTRIDLVLDLIAGKSRTEREEYFTFFFFSAKAKRDGMRQIWEEIQNRYLTLRGWYEDRGLYHKIGYLIATGDETYSLARLFARSAGLRKSEFEAELDSLIRESVAEPRVSGEKRLYHELDYTNGRDKALLQRLLLLFNVESVRAQTDMQRFPFELYKTAGTWSLEHIHAQNSDSLKDEKQWRQWLEEHRNALEALDRTLEQGRRHTALIGEIDARLAKSSIGSENFRMLQETISEALSADGGESIHHIGNLALLPSRNNAVLSNSVFAVKRLHIIGMDKRGEFIPPCTKKVFLKYYSVCEGTGLYYWGHDDAAAYIEEIDRVLKDYLEERIAASFGEEV